MRNARQIAEDILRKDPLPLSLLVEAGLATSDGIGRKSFVSIGSYKSKSIEWELRYLICYKAIVGGRRISNFEDEDRAGAKCLREFAEYFDDELSTLSDLADDLAKEREAFSSFYRKKYGSNDVCHYMAVLGNLAKEAGTDFSNMSEADVLDRLERLVAASISLSKYVEGSPSADPFAYDVWRIDELAEYCHTGYNESMRASICNFLKIRNLSYRDVAKSFLKVRITRGKRISFSTARQNTRVMTKFMNYVDNSVTEGLANLKRRDIEHFFVSYCTDNEALAASSWDGMIGCIKAFIEWLQQTESEFAPSVPSTLLVLDSDYRKIEIDTVTDRQTPKYILEQLAAQWDEVDEDIQILLFILSKTGLRISDALQLKKDCLALEPDGWWVSVDIEKIPKRGHRVPIDDELAEQIRSFAARPICADVTTNPKGWLFINPDAKKQGGPWLQDEMQRRINKLLEKFEIFDADGEVPSFRFHGMRHRYAMAILNSGGNILDVQELLGHRSTTMADVYAHLTEKHKKDTFQKAVKQGLFSFIDDGVECTL